MQAGTFFFRRWEEGSFVFLFFFNTLLASFHAASRAHRSCHSVSSWDRSSNFGALGWGSPGQIIPSDGFCSRMLAWRNTAFVNFTHRIGFRMSELFRKVDEDFGGSISWKTQPKCRVFDESYTTGLPVLSGCSSFRQPGGVRKSTFPKTCILFLTCRTSTPEDSIFHRSELCKFLWGDPCTAVEPFSTWASASRTSGSRCMFHTLLRWRSWRRVRLCRFCTLIRIVSETAIVSFWTLPVSFPLPTIS